MRLLDSRRLTGANLFLARPGAVVDVAVDGDDVELLSAAWRRHARRLLEELDWPVELAVRPFEGGVSLALAAPEDGLYAATELNEAALDAAREHSRFPDIPRHRQQHGNCKLKFKLQHHAALSEHYQNVNKFRREF